MVGTESSVAMGFIAMSVLITPLTVRLYRRNWTAAILFKLLAGSSLILLGTAAMKVNLDWAALWDGRLVGKLGEVPLAPSLWMLGAVGFEAAQEVIKVRLATHLDTDRIPTAELGVALGSKSPGEAAVQVLLLQSIPICVFLSSILFLLTAPPPISLPNFSESVSCLWYVVWFTLLAFFGNFARPKLLNPLTTKGLDHEAFPPWLAVRPIVFFIMALGADSLVRFVLSHTGVGSCGEATCVLPLLVPDFWYVGAGQKIQFSINVDVVPKAQLSYWVGLSFISVIFIWKASYFWKYGFALEDQEISTGVRFKQPV
jgi:hypothetical protein